MTRTVATPPPSWPPWPAPDPADACNHWDGAAGAVAALRTLALDPTALAGVRVGVVRGEAPEDEKPDPHRLACHEQALAVLAAAGALVRDVTLPPLSHDDELTVLHHEFAPGVTRYLAGLGTGAPVRSLAELQAWNLANADAALKFGQLHVDTAVAVDHERDGEAYRATRQRDLRTTSDGLQAALGDDLECLVFPGADGCSWAARAGWPSIVIPAGYTANSRRPVGIMLVSRPWTDARLLEIAYAFEQANPIRRTPAEINPAAFRHR